MDTDQFAEAADFCPKSSDGKHQPDINTLAVNRESDGAYFDLNCKLCGRSGCAGKFDPEKIDW